MVVSAIETANQTASAGETILMRQARWFVGFASLGAATTHVMAAFQHRSESTSLALMFGRIAVAQVRSSYLMPRPYKLLALVGIILNTDLLLAWVSSRTKG